MLSLSALCVHRGWKFHLTTAKGCAWRAMYLTGSSRKNDWRGWQLMWIGIDPNTSWGPKLELFGNFFGWDFRTVILTAKWKHKANRLERWWYGKKVGLIYALDGRCGWGTKKKVLTKPV